MNIPLLPFISGSEYSRANVFDILQLVPHPQQGNWATGYNSYNGSHFIFCTIGSPSSIGYDYDNAWEDQDLLRWQGKTKSTIDQPQIQAMIRGTQPVYLFHRSKPHGPFTFAGLAHYLRHAGSHPVTIWWNIERVRRAQTTRVQSLIRDSDIQLPEEVAEPALLTEGGVKTVTVNAYERNPEARRKCIEHYGAFCQACEVNFGERYGERGEGFIHVHHTIPLKTRGGSYVVDPIKDLIPVCPNCHAMLHRGEPLLTVEKLREIFKGVGGAKS